MTSTFHFREIDAALNRISRMIRGIGDPLVASYARCYLVRVGVSVSSDWDFVGKTFADFLTTYQTVSCVVQCRKQMNDLTLFLFVDLWNWHQS